MSRALDIPALRREWRMSRALKDADLNGIIAGDPATDNQSNMDAIWQRHDERTKATVAAIVGAENKALSIRDAWAILNLALAVAEDDENPEAARPLFEKAERVLKALRDAMTEQPERTDKTRRLGRPSNPVKPADKRDIELDLDAAIDLMSCASDAARHINVTGISGITTALTEASNKVCDVLERLGIAGAEGNSE